MANKKPTQVQVAEFEMLWPILKSLLAETKELSKKKSDNSLNKLKVDMINKVLVKIKGILSDDPSLQFLELLDNETLPSNSDAAFIMAQYDAAMQQFKNKYYGYDEDENEQMWFTSN